MRIIVVPQDLHPDPFQKRRHPTRPSAFLTRFAECADKLPPDGTLPDLEGVRAGYLAARFAGFVRGQSKSGAGEVEGNWEGWRGVYRARTFGAGRDGWRWTGREGVVQVNRVQHELTCCGFLGGSGGGGGRWVIHQIKAQWGVRMESRVGVGFDYWLDG
jgi:hypothetical protein